MTFKQRINQLWSNYIYIGGILAIPMAISYFYQLANMVMKMGNPGLEGGFYPMLVAFGWCFLMPFTRALLWGPSLMLWFMGGADHFLFWLAPGFYEPPGRWHL